MVLEVPVALWAGLLCALSPHGNQDKMNFLKFGRRIKTQLKLPPYSGVLLDERGEKVFLLLHSWECGEMEA